MTYFDDVRDFHVKFGLPAYPLQPPCHLTDDLLAFRGAFLLEELAEFFAAARRPEVASTLVAAGKALKDYRAVPFGMDLAKAADALADLVYVALGTAHFMGIPFDAVWEEVQRANMTKERATSSGDARSTRRHGFDVVKPDGWRAPDHAAALRDAGWVG